MRSQEIVRNLNYLISTRSDSENLQAHWKHLSKIDFAERFSTQKFVFFANLPFVPKIIGDRIF